MSDLGPSSFRLHGFISRRDDFTLVTSRDLHLACSWYFPVHNTPLPCVVFCHGNCGCRLDGLEIMKALLPLGISVLTFDFGGSGMSDGEFVSLGYFEKEDIREVVRYARAQPQVKSISLWGRSMGASAALLYASEDPNIALLVLDSPFTSLTELIKEQILRLKWFPSSISLQLLKKMKKRIAKEARFDIDEVSPIRVVGRCNAPCAFVHSRGDELIPIDHSLKLYSMYCSPMKQFFKSDGGHNTPRPVCLLELLGRSVHRFSGTKPFSGYTLPPISTQRSLRALNVIKRMKVFSVPRTLTDTIQNTYRSTADAGDGSDASKLAVLN